MTNKNQPRNQEKPTSFFFSSFEKSDFHVPAASTKHLAHIHTLQHEYGGMAVPHHIVRRHPVALYKMKRQNCCFQTSVFVQIFVSGLSKCLRSACHVISWLLLHHSFSSCNKIKWSLEMFFLGAMFHASSHRRRPRHTMGGQRNNTLTNPTMKDSENLLNIFMNKRESRTLFKSSRQK